MSKAQRAKGRRGETEARLLLEGRDYMVDDLTAGLSTADLIATDSSGVSWVVEVKNQKSINLPEFLKQAKANAARRKWMLMCKLDGQGEWLVLRQGMNGTVWSAA